MSYSDDLIAAQNVLGKLALQREELETAIAKQKRKIAALAELCQVSEEAEQVIDLDLGGLTEACRTVLRGSRKEWMTTAEIQSGLKELGFPIHEYKAPAASILTTVNRLVESGDVVIDKRPQPGASEYKWAGVVKLTSLMNLSRINTLNDILQEAAKTPKRALTHPTKGLGLPRIDKK